MRFITSFLMCITLAFSQLSGFGPIGIALFNSDMTRGTGESIDLPTIGQNVVTEPDTSDIVYEVKTYDTSSFITLDLEGYCTIEIPESHYKVRSSSTATVKELEYKDNKTRLTMSYVTNIGSDADIPGYITREVAGVETTTNNKVIENYGGDKREWMKVPAENRIDGCNVYVWYTLNEDKSAAFWVKAKVAPDSDSAEFYSVMGQIFNTYHTYGGNGTIFEAPEGFEVDDGTNGDTSNYQSNNSLANQVFSTRGGCIVDADISPSWQDLEFILDGVKFKLPCTLDDFYQANYVVNDKKVTADNMEVKAGETLDVTLQNDNGTVVKVTFYNGSLKMSQQADDCSIMRVVIDSDAFVNVSDIEKLKKQQEREEASLAEEEAAKQAEKEAEEKEAEEENKQFITITQNVNIREKPNTTAEIYREAETGEKFEYIRMSDDETWYCIKYFEDESSEDYKEAFIKSKFAELDSNDAESTESTESTDDESQDTDNKTDENADENTDNDNISDNNSNNTELDEGIIKKVKVVKITYSTDIMGGPYNTAEKLGTATHGDTYDYLGVSENGEWFKIRYGLLEGYANVKNSRLVEITEEEYKEAEQYMKELDGRAQEEEAAENIRKEEEAKNNQDEEGSGLFIQDKSQWDESYDAYGHQMILAGGITWPAYADDIITYYGSGVSRSAHNNGQQLRLKWTQGEKYMTLITGNIKQIYYVEISCVPDN